MLYFDLMFMSAKMHRRETLLAFQIGALHSRKLLDIVPPMPNPGKPSILGEASKNNHLWTIASNVANIEERLLIHREQVTPEAASECKARACDDACLHNCVLLPACQTTHQQLYMIPSMIKEPLGTKAHLQLSRCLVPSSWSVANSMLEVLTDGAYLRGEVMGVEAQVLQDGNPSLNCHKPNQTGCNVEGRDDACSQAELVDDDAEHRAQHGSNKQRPKLRNTSSVFRGQVCESHQSADLPR